MIAVAFEIAMIESYPLTSMLKYYWITNFLLLSGLLVHMYQLGYYRGMERGVDSGIDTALGYSVSLLRARVNLDATRQQSAD